MTGVAFDDKNKNQVINTGEAVSRMRVYADLNNNRQKFDSNEPNALTNASAHTLSLAPNKSYTLRAVGPASGDYEPITSLAPRTLHAGDFR